MGGARVGRSPNMNAGAAVYAHRTVRCGVPRGTAAAPAGFGGAIARGAPRSGTRLGCHAIGACPKGRGLARPP